MYEKIVSALITGLLIAPLTSYITVRMSLSRFKDEKRWQRQVDAYERVLNALHVIKKNNTAWDNAFRIDSPTPPDEKLQELDAKRREAMDFLELSLDLGEFILHKDVLTDIRTMLGELRNMDINEDNFNAAYQMENNIIERALEKIRSKSI